MNQPKWTPGPWGIEQTYGTNWIGPLRRNSNKIAEIVCNTDREGLKPEAVERNDANARLIAAAPELVEAGKAAIECRDGWQEMMRDALAKAGAAVSINTAEMARLKMDLEIAQQNLRWRWNASGGLVYD